MKGAWASSKENIKRLKEWNHKNHFRHGMRKEPIYAVWWAMMQRCNDPNHKAYKNYGARGIKVCEQWHDFVCFFKDMGIPPRNMSIDRIDVNGNYTPENCRWATRVIQARNRRNNHLIEFKGECLCISEWAERFKINKSLIRERIIAGWKIDDIFKPAMKPGSWRKPGRRHVSKKIQLFLDAKSRNCRVCGLNKTFILLGSNKSGKGRTFHDGKNIWHGARCPDCNFKRILR